MRAELQYFGSTTERFKEETGQKATANPNVGPGAYYQPHRKLEPPNARGFCTTQERFKADEGKVALGPGPGDYHTPGVSENMTMTFSMLGNSGGLAFGTMNKRFVYPPDDGPGPGSYVLGGLSEEVVDTAPEEFDQRGRARRKPFKASRLPGAAFASRTPKDAYTMSLIREGAQKPPPGAYDPVLVKDQATVVRLRSKSEGFLSGGDRFQGGPLSAPKGGVAVGPGQYSPQMITGGKRAGTFNRALCEGIPPGGCPKGLGFDTQDKRWKTKAGRDRAPGPGDYNTDPRWITKSYNCYFGDLT
jgi:hypothetical protein